MTSATGSNMWALTLDSTGSFRFYNIWTKLIKMSVSNNVSSEVTTLSATPYTLAYYNNTVYYGGIGGTGIVGAVTLRHDAVSYTLNTQEFKSSHSRLILIVP